MPPSDSVPATTLDLQVRDLGRMPYAEAFALQRELQAQVIADRSSADGQAPRRMYVLLVEHDPPVITVSRRKTARQHLIASDEQLRAAGVEIAETDRGGDITYHGPGQLVVYPILDLNVLGLRLHGYMRLLEQVVIDVLADYGLAGTRDESATGVWVRPHAPGSPPASAGGVSDETVRTSARPLVADSSGAASDPAPSKICAMGVRVSRWVSMHGLALNVSTDLRHFQLIVPCGLAGRGVTSMQHLLGEACPSMDAVKRAIVGRMSEAASESAKRRAGDVRVG